MSSTPRDLAAAVPYAPRPKPDSARQVQLCSQRLYAVEPEFAVAFHRALRELSPNVTGPATGPGGSLSGQLAHCVLWAALTHDPVEIVEGKVRDFAAHHHAQGFPDDAYSSIGHALLRSVRDILPAGWSSELSSSWISYALWLRPHLEAGARSAFPGATPRAADLLPLEVIFDILRTQFFPGQTRDLSAVCTRVMLRTGADLRNPRPDQRTDPQVISEVLENLLLMGYDPTSGRAGTNEGPPPDRAPTTFPERGEQPAPEPRPRAPRRRFWSLRRYRREAAGEYPQGPRRE
jgi:hypothetical protein